MAASEANARAPPANASKKYPGPSATPGGAPSPPPGKEPTITARPTASGAGASVARTDRMHRSKCARRNASAGSSAREGKTSPLNAHADAHATLEAAHVARSARRFSEEMLFEREAARCSALVATSTIARSVVSWRSKSQSNAPGARRASRHGAPGVILESLSRGPSPPPRSLRRSRANAPDPAPAPPRAKSHASAVVISSRAATHTPSSRPVDAAPDSWHRRAMPAPCAKKWRRKSASRLARHRSWKSHGRFIGDAVLGLNSEMTAEKSLRPVRRAALVDALATAASASASIAPRSASSSSHARFSSTASVLTS